MATLITNQYMPDAQIRGFVADELRGMATTIVVDESRPVIRPSAPDGMGMMDAFVPCLYRILYRLAEPILCCVCGQPLAGPIEFKRFGKYPTCSSECASTPVSKPVI